MRTYTVRITDNLTNAVELRYLYRQNLPQAFGDVWATITDHTRYTVQVID